MQADTLVELSAVCHRGGYRLITGLISPKLPGKEPMRRLRILQPAVSGAKLKRYSPPADLYVQFARTALTDEAILDFANTYGLLGLPELLVSVREGGIMLRGESVEHWRGEIEAMNYALERWHLVQTAKPRADKTSEWKWREPVLAFDDFLEAVNRNLPKGALALVKTKKLKARLRIVTHSLKELLWLQLAQAKSADAIVRQCANSSCRKWIVATPGTRSFRRTTHNDSCRSSSYQKRKTTKRTNSSKKIR